MGNKAYTWDETLSVERRGEAVLDAIFGVEFIIVRATKWHQKQKMDRFQIHRKDGRIIHRVDYKVDEKAGKTSNLALEHVSVLQNGQRKAMGWVHETISDLIVSYVPAKDTAYVMKVTTLRQWWPEIQKLFELRETSTVDVGRNWITQFYAVPIQWLKSNGIIDRELEAVGAQLRLNLKY